MPQNILHICELFMFTVLKEALVSVLIFRKRKIKPSDLKHWHLVLSNEQSWSLLLSSIVVFILLFCFHSAFFTRSSFRILIFKWNKYTVWLFLRNLYTCWSKCYLQLKCEMPPIFLRSLVTCPTGIFACIMVSACEGTSHYLIMCLIVFFSIFYLVMHVARWLQINSGHLVHT